MARRVEQPGLQVGNLLIQGAVLLQEHLANVRGGKQVGVVTQAMYSPLNNHTVAIARLPVDCANNGTDLVVNCGTHGAIKAKSHSLPFYDIDKKRRSAQG